MAYVRLGPRPKTAAPDTTGNNAGKYTTAYTQGDLAITVPYFEVYQIGVTGGLGSEFQVFINTQLWNAVPTGFQNSYDPSQPIILEPGDELFFYWNLAVSGNTPPQTTLWLRADTAFTGGA